MTIVAKMDTDAKPLVLSAHRLNLCQGLTGSILDERDVADDRHRQAREIHSALMKTGDDRALAAGAKVYLANAVIERYGIKRFRQQRTAYGGCLSWVADKQCGRLRSRECEFCGASAWFDHTRFVFCEKFGVKYKLVLSQPYGISLEDLSKLVVLCHKHGLVFDIDSCSPHFPLNTVLIAVRRKIDVDKIAAVPSTARTM